MTISYDVTATLRAETKHHEPVILEPRSPDGGEPRVYTGGIVPTLNTYGGATDTMHCVELSASR